MLIAAVVFINEFQDMNADARAGKRTLVVRMGLPKASRRLRAASCSRRSAPIAIGAAAGLLPRTTLLALGALPFALRAIAVARKKLRLPERAGPGERAHDRLTHTLTGALLAVGYLIAR